MWDGYLRFYGERLPEEVTAATFLRLCDGAGGADGMFGFVAESEGGVVGLVHAIVHPTTWALGPNCYLEDLFVAEPARGDGVGRELIEAVAIEARRRGAVTVYWHTQAFNGRARTLYDKVGKLLSWVVYEIPLGTVAEPGSDRPG